jgi:hypothetical protein
MGSVVFEAPVIEGGDRRLRAYRHSSTSGDGSSCVLLINLRPDPASVALEGSIRERFMVSPTDGLRSSHILLNGVSVGEDLVFAWGKEKTARHYRVRESEGPGLELPGYSYAFVIVDLVSRGA